MEKKKVYIISYEDCMSGEYYSGISYVFDTLEKAKIMLDEIKEDEIYQYIDDIPSIRERIEDIENGFIVNINYDCDYTKYEICETEIQ